MAKLELEHLAPYLPYNLQIQHNQGDIFLLTGFSSEHGDSFKMLELMDEHFSKHFCNFIAAKPILRPMTDFNKLIIMFDYPVEISILSIINIAKYDMYTYHPKLNTLRRKSNTGYEEYNFKVNGQLSLPYRMFSLLLQNKFDVFGLIEQGLAIDINTTES